MNRRLVAACLATMLPLAPAAATTKDELVIGVAQFPFSMHPDIDPEVVKGYVLGFALRGLSAFDKDWKNICRLCTELPTLANGLVRLEQRADGGPGMAVTVKLRPGLLWGDGAKLTAADLAFTAKVGHDPGSGFADGRLWGRVASVEVIDAQTAVLHLNEVSALYDRLPGILPEHVEAPALARGPGNGGYPNQTLYNRAPTTPGLYNGPYRITAYSSGENIVLEPNPYWHGRKPALRRIVVRAIGNTAALAANLLAGDVDMAPGDAPSLTLDQVLALRQQHPDRFTYVFQPALTYEHVDLNLDNPFLADIRVRRALLLALDRRAMTERMFGGLQPVADGFVNPADPMHADGLPGYPYDPAQAKALLAQAGWTPGPDGIRRNAAGVRLTLEFRTTTGNRLRELQQQVMQDQWKAVGIEVTIKNEPARTLFGETMKQRSFGALAMYAWTSAVSYPPRQMLGSDQVPSAANAFGGSNYMDFRSPAVDADILAAETDLDAAHRKSAWADMQRIYAEELPALPLFFRAEAYVLPKWLHGVTPTGHTDMTSEWVEDWVPQ